MSTIGVGLGVVCDGAAVLVTRRGEGPACFVAQRRGAGVFEGFFSAPIGLVEAQDSAPDVRAAELRARCALRVAIEELGWWPRAEADATAAANALAALRDGYASLRELLPEAGAALQRLRSLGIWPRAHAGAPRGDLEVFRLELDAAELKALAPAEWLADGAWLSPHDALARWRADALRMPWAVRCALSTMAQVDDPLAGVEGAFEWVSGVRWIALGTPTLPPATHTNALVIGQRELTVVDPGSGRASEQRRLAALLDRLELAGARATRVLLTHGHGDHVGGVGVLRERGLAVWAHPDTARLLHGPVDRELRGGERLVEDGASDGDWEVLYTPGHVGGHLSLWHGPSRSLVCGDVMAAVGTVVVQPPEGDMAAYFATLHALRALSPRTVWAAHGPPIEAPVEHIDAYLEHRNSRERQILDAMGREPVEVHDIVKQVYVDVPRTAWPLARRNVEAHLAKLVAEGRVMQEGGGYRRLDDVDG